MFGMFRAIEKTQKNSQQQLFYNAQNEMIYSGWYNIISGILFAIMLNFFFLSSNDLCTI